MRDLFDFVYLDTFDTHRRQTQTRSSWVKKLIAFAPKRSASVSLIIVEESPCRK